MSDTWTDEMYAEAIAALSDKHAKLLSLPGWPSSPGERTRDRAIASALSRLRLARAKLDRRSRMTPTPPARARSGR